jgi:hypothetical protein
LKKLLRGEFATFTVKREVGASLVSLLMGIILGLPLYTLHLKEASEGRELAAVPVQQGDLFKVEYVHSIYKVKQSEIFSIGGDLRFYLEKVMFGSYAAADYYESDPPLGLPFRDGGWMVKGNGKNYAILKYRVSPGTGHVFILGNLKLDLSAAIRRSGDLIEIFLESKKGN